MGPVSQNSLVTSKTSLFVNVAPPLEESVRKFWELDEIPLCSPISKEEAACEKLFVDGHSRDPSGRYIVPLPFKVERPILGDSRSIAHRRFLMLERRLKANHELYKSYSDFMREYVSSGHMSIVETASNQAHVYYIPHHCVLRPDSSTTKLRVVFDASCRTSDGRALNDVLLIGPKLQQDLPKIILNFRCHKIALVADIRQMFLQILIQESHRDYQRLFWRFAESDPILEYRLNTVTFGVASSPFLALRTLLQLAQDEGCSFPLAASVLKSDIYVDDIVTGAASLSEVSHLRDQLIELFKRGGFELRKWASNCLVVLNDVPTTHQLPLDFDSDSLDVKVLGLQWNPSTDCFSYRVSVLTRACSKRTILSELARIYDPLGFLTPVSFMAKYLIQYLWRAGVDWDEEPPNDVLQIWTQFKEELSSLASIKIPRFILEDMLSVQLHGFCDASERGYACVVYLRVVRSDGQTFTSLLAGRSKVAPTKTVSIPRLELCAADLLAGLLTFVIRDFKLKIDPQETFAWSDSLIVLSWIKSCPSKWKTFVANRVSRIQEKTEPSNWNHVSSSDNPADCASRGLLPLQLKEHELWWTGPSWLLQSPNKWQTTSVAVLPTTGEERTLTLVAQNNIDSFLGLLQKFSSLPKILRIISYVRRFHVNRNLHGPPSAIELDQALKFLDLRVQKLCFEDVFDRLSKTKVLPKYLRKLALAIDESDGLLRVGGRLSNAALPKDTKHPMLLPRDHRLTHLIIEDCHNRHLHPGPRTLRYLLLQQFWILSPKRAISRCLSECVRCFRCAPKSLTPYMGNLPAVRVSQVKPFSHVGVDFAGPFFVSMSRRRGVKPSKAYVCLFICFAVKAIHLELVSDRSSEAFIAALRRFVSRRGRCDHIYSDCGTNFVGAWKILQALSRTSAEHLGIQWHFNPPAAPHFGGLWEAGVKSTKSHLVRIVGEQILSYEELNTILIQIESVLNSRPLCPLSSSPDDLQVLTPGHFLTLEPLSAPPEEDLTKIRLNRLNRWQLLQRCHQDFWKRWHAEYLHTLQQRGKWHNPTENVLSKGSIVLIKHENNPPLRWPLARVVRVHPGADGVVRVATVQTANGELQRPIAKLCPLPLQ